MHRVGKSIGRADGLSRTHLRAFIAIVSEGPAAYAPEEDPEWPNRTKESPPDPKHFQYSEIQGDVLQPTDSIAHCISADSKLGAGIARRIRRRVPTQYPGKEAIASKVIWPQWIPESQRFVYHLKTKAHYFHQPTYKALRASLEAMQTHKAYWEQQCPVHQQIGCGLDKSDWQKVWKLIHEIFQPKSLDPTVFLKPGSGTLNSSQIPMDSLLDTDTAKAVDDSNNIPSLESAQRNDAALKHLLHWITRGMPPGSQDLHGLPRTTWRLAHDFRSLKVVNDVLCREFVHKGGSSNHQQLVLASLVPQILKSIHSSPTGGHLGIIKTAEKVPERFYWPGFQEDIKRFIIRCEQCQKKSQPAKDPSTIFGWIGPELSFPSHWHRLHGPLTIVKW